MVTFLLILLLMIPAPSLGSTFVLSDQSEEAMFESSDVIALAEVAEIRSIELEDGRIETEIDLRVIDAYKGTFGGATVVVTQPGGKVGDKVQWIPGSPEYVAGERAYVFLRKTKDGKLTTNLMTVGRVPDILEAPSLLGGGEKDPVKDLKNDLKRRLQKEKPLPSTGAPLGLIQPQRLEGDGQEHLTFRFMQPPSKWKDMPVSVVGDKAGDSKVGFQKSQESVVNATGVWQQVADLDFVYAPPGQGRGFVCDPGKLLVSFDDPLEQIQDPIGCSSGALAVGGFCAVGGKITAGAVVFGNNWEDCWFWNELSLAEIMTHEIGHAIGLAHSWEGDMGSPSDPRIIDATMFWTAHMDGRGAALKEYDVGASQAHYGSRNAPPDPTATPEPEATPEPTASPSPSPSPSPTASPEPTEYIGQIDIWMPYSSNDQKGVIIDIEPYTPKTMVYVRNADTGKKVRKRGKEMPIWIRGQKYPTKLADGKLEWKMGKNGEWRPLFCEKFGLKHTTQVRCELTPSTKSSTFMSLF